MTSVVSRSNDLLCALWIFPPQCLQDEQLVFREELAEQTTSDVYITEF